MRQIQTVVEELAKEGHVTAVGQRFVSARERRDTPTRRGTRVVQHRELLPPFRGESDLLQDGAALGIARIVPQQPQLVEDEVDVGGVEQVHGGIRVLIPTAFHPSGSTAGA